jgi:hypothetical protein
MAVPIYDLRYAYPFTVVISMMKYIIFTFRPLSAIFYMQCYRGCGALLIVHITVIVN